MPGFVNCRVCGKEFYTKNKRRTVCYDKHPVYCSNCGCLASEDSWVTGEKRENFLCKKCRKDRGVERRKQFYREHYGVEHALQVPEIKRKQEQTTTERYGSTNIWSSEEGKRKIRETNFERYGVECFLQSEKVSKMRVERDLSEDNPSYRELSDQTVKILRDRDLFISTLESIPFRERSIDRINEVLQVSSTSCIRKYIAQYDVRHLVNYSKSNFENEVKEYIMSLGVKTVNDRWVLGDKLEIDIYCPDHRVGFEVNGGFYHSEMRLYHKNKSDRAREKGVFIYHIFDYQWYSDKQKIIKSQIRNLLKLNSLRVFARDCEVRLVSGKDAREFLTNNHLQGYRNSKYRIGLYHKDMLVQLMTFGKDKIISKSENLQLLRSCSLLDTTVVGGTSKLFSYFVKNYCNNGDVILSYCNASTGTGKTYEKLGFMFESLSKPNYIWFCSYNLVTKTRYQCQRHMLEGIQEDETESEYMRDRGYVKIYDSGNLKFSYTVKK